mgnify:CR=1 FL=1
MVRFIIPDNRIRREGNARNTKGKNQENDLLLSHDERYRNELEVSNFRGAGSNIDEIDTRSNARQRRGANLVTSRVSASTHVTQPPSHPRGVHHGIIVRSRLRY